MGLRDFAKQDLERITSDLNDWSAPVRFIAPTGEILDTFGISNVHTLQAMEGAGGGLISNVIKATVEVSEKVFIDASYPCRNASGQFDMEGHFAEFMDTTGSSTRYKVSEWMPDQMLGFIVLILEFYNDEE
ncbi:MAG: hypothetical protein EBW87_00070 [Burkholderiaceae bacterium]|nr:hypothetical protein [Burkholderiaceae bacterium]